MRSWTLHSAVITVIFVSGAKLISKSITAPCCWCEPRSLLVPDLAGITDAVCQQLLKERGSAAAPPTRLQAKHQVSKGSTAMSGQMKVSDRQRTH